MDHGRIEEIEGFPVTDINFVDSSGPDMMTFTLGPLKCQHHSKLPFVYCIIHLNAIYYMYIHRSHPQITSHLGGREGVLQVVTWFDKGKTGG